MLHAAGLGDVMRMSADQIGVVTAGITSDDEEELGREPSHGQPPTTASACVRTKGRCSPGAAATNTGAHEATTRVVGSTPVKPPPLKRGKSSPAIGNSPGVIKDSVWSKASPPRAQDDEAENGVSEVAEDDGEEDEDAVLHASELHQMLQYMRTMNGKKAGRASRHVPALVPLLKWHSGSRPRIRVP